MEPFVDNFQNPTNFVKVSDILDNCQKNLEGIKELERRKVSLYSCLNGFAGTFPKLRNSYLNDIETVNKSIERVYGWYLKNLGRLNCLSENK